MPNPATVREQRLRKTKAQLIDEIDTLEQRASAIEAANRSSAPMGAKATEGYLANQQLADLARFTSENPNPVLRAMPDGIVLYANDAAIAMNGLLKGRKKSTLAGDLAGVCADASRTAEVQETEFESGDRVFAFSIAPVAGETYINIYGRDITERKRAEHELAEKEAQFRLALDNMPGGIRLVDNDRNYVFFNQQYLDLHDFPEGLLKVGESNRVENLYQAQRGDFGPGDPVALTDQWLSIATEQTERSSWERTLEGGKVLQVRTSPTPDGGYVSIVTDITERKRAEESLREKTEFLQLNQAITRAANEAESVEDAMKIALDQVCAQTGWPVGHVYLFDEMLGDLAPTKTWHLGNAEEFETFRRITEATRFGSGIGLPGRVLASGQPAWIMDVTKDPNFPRAQLAMEIGVRAGAAFPVLVGRQVAAVLEFFSDKSVEPYEPLMEVIAQIGTQLGRVIERTRAKTQLLGAKEQAEAATEAKSRFLANMSHELRTPLNAVIGITEMLIGDAEKFGQDDFVEPLQRISRAGKHLLNLINEILDLSKIEAGKMELYTEDFDVGDTLDNVTSMTMTLIEKKNNALATDYGENLGVMHNDMTKLRQNLFNLISNAAKFSENGTITLSAHRETRDAKDWLVFKVTDTGIGIPEEKLGEIFKEFSQAEESTTKDYGGTGLGLTLAKRFTEMMGGRIWAQSVPGKGSTFIMEVPAEV